MHICTLTHFLHTHASAGTAASLGSPHFHPSPSVFPSARINNTRHRQAADYVNNTDPEFTLEAYDLPDETPQPCRRRSSRASSYRKPPSRRPCSLPRRKDDDAELKPLPGATTTSTTKRAEPKIDADADADAASWENNAEAEQQARCGRCTASLHHLTTPRLVPCLAWTFDEPFGEH